MLLKEDMFFLLSKANTWTSAFQTEHERCQIKESIGALGSPIKGQIIDYKIQHLYIWPMSELPILSFAGKLKTCSIQIPN